MFGLVLTARTAILVLAEATCLGVAVAMTAQAMTPPDRLVITRGSGLTTKAQAEPRTTIVGTRMTKGDAVECPKLRSDDGSVVGVSYLAPSIKIGDRVSATGFFTKMVRCRGTVLFVEDLKILD